MNINTYEKHILKDPTFPITLHFNTANESGMGFYLHWHEHIEIHYVVSGTGIININNRQVKTTAGDIVVINSNALHSLNARPMDYEYHCLIINKMFCDNYFLPIDSLTFQSIIKDEEAISIMNNIINEMEDENEYYKYSVRSNVILLLILLLRKYSYGNGILNDQCNGQKFTIVKEAINYIGKHYNETISIEQLCNHVGFSKYYFCHTFKEVTGQTAFDYINILRCNKAKNLLTSGKYNVSEAAIACGFNNLSYFAKTYKKYIGVLPSKENINIELK